MESNNNYIKIGATLGGVSGAIYGYYHPSEQTLLKISRIKPNVVETFEGYKDCFNMENAEKAFQENKLSKSEYNKLKNWVGAITDTWEKEKQVVDILNTPYEERTKTYRAAVKEANGSRKNLWKSILGFTVEFQNKLTELNIFNQEKFAAIKDATGKKVLKTIKELLKGSGIGLVAGAAVGTFIGYILKRIAISKNS